ncbi:MAG: lipid II flippase MurJ [Geminocystis sp.]|nr:lipid II flippase MurJ [Geminocystis sp.]
MASSWPQPSMGIFLIFADAFDSLGVPQLVRAREQGEEEFKKIASIMFTFALLISISMLILSLSLMQVILKIPVGFSPQALEATRSSYVLLIPCLAFSFVLRQLGAVLRSQRKFTQCFIAEIIMAITNLTATLTGLLLTKDFRVLAVSNSISQGVGTIYMLCVSRRFVSIKFYIDENTKKLMSHFLQLSLLYGVFHLYVIVDRTFASYLGERAVSALAYGLIVAGIPKNILRFEDIAMTSLAELGGSTNKLNFYLKKLALFTWPIVIFFFIIPRVPVRLLFGYGAFSKVDVDLVAIALKFYALSIPFMFFWPLIYRVFQIRGKLLGVGLVAIAGVVTNALLNYIFVFYLDMGIAGICLGTFGSNLVTCGLGYIMLVGGIPKG